MDLIIWLITPPNNIKLFIDELPEHWKHGNVILVCCHDVRKERRQTGYTSECENVHEVHILDNMDSSQAFLDVFFEAHKKDVHVFGGLRKEPAPIMYRLRKAYGPSVRIAAFTEKPAIHSGSWPKQVVKKALYKPIYRHVFAKARKTVDLLFVISESGIRAVRELGWNKNNLYEIMYCGYNATVVQSSLDVRNRPIRFLYVGRFDYSMRGVDVLMAAFDSLNEKDWELCLVGGYGNERDEIIAWTQKNDNVTFGGTWPADQVIKRMVDFDVFICPAKEDSWNNQINMAISAGLGVITTDEAGSDELVRVSGAGVVIKKNDPIALRKCVESVICDREVLCSWKKNAVEYAEKISVKTVAEYFCNVLEGSFITNNPSVKCPWL